ncbi:MAG: hypothetical protein JO276_11665 [Sphingomonadaceae bacterium]|nr:hypothetical protein [Sphingomonadaceae bacterium]
MSRIWAAVVAIFILFPSSALAQSAQGRPVVAVYQMDDLAQSGAGDTFSTMIETAVASTGRFRVIERQRLHVAEREQQMARTGRVTTNRPGRSGGFEGADFLIYGTITSISTSDRQQLGASMLLGALTGNQSSNCTRRAATLAVDIRITDADSGEIRNVSRITETQQAAMVCNGQSQIDAPLLLRGAAEKIARALVTAIYPVQVAAVQPDGTIILNYGEGTLQTGNYLTVYSRGEQIIDPTTHQVIGNSETKLGVIRVNEVSERMSRASAVSTFAAQPPIGSVARTATEEDVQAATHAGRRRR